MKQDRLFFVAPDVVHVTLTYDRLCSTWSARITSTVVAADGSTEHHVGDVVNYLAPAEALDVVCATVALELNV